MRMLLAGLIAMVAISPASAAEPSGSRYAIGQVWAYRTRPQDAGSLLKIGAIETDNSKAAAPVYHISLIKVRLGPGGSEVAVNHLPVSRETLDASVTELTHSDVAFPDPAEGISIWRQDKGGVFTIPVKDILDAIAQAAGPAAASDRPSGSPPGRP